MADILNQAQSDYIIIVSESAMKYLRLLQEIYILKMNQLMQQWSR